MADLTLWIDQEISKLKRDMDRLMFRLKQDIGLPILPITAGEVPLIDLTEAEDNLIVTAEMPGLEPEDLDITIGDDTLTISGQIKQEAVEEGESHKMIEKIYGNFSRTLQLPCRIRQEEAEAAFEKGVLTIVMPKYTPGRAREVKIRIE
jgi:HSP20 family protein